MRPLPPDATGADNDLADVLDHYVERAIADGLADRRPHEADLLAARGAAAAAATLNGGVALGNKGGSITLLERTGLKVSGVSYTAEQARSEGWTVTF